MKRYRQAMRDKNGNLIRVMDSSGRPYLDLIEDEKGEWINIEELRTELETAKHAKYEKINILNGKRVQDREPYILKLKHMIEEDKDLLAKLEGKK